jgi:protein-tyrosine-phosphatase
MHCGQHAPSPIEQGLPSHPNGHEQMSQIISILSLFGGLLPRVIGLIVSMALLCTGAVAQDSPRSDKPTVVFVCLHGSVKSQVAAAHFNRIAKERGLSLVAISRGIAVDPSIPASIRQGLAADGLTPPDDVPVPLASADTTGAIEVFAFDEVPNDRKGSREVTYWSDVPPATKDYVAARDAIVRHIEEAMTSLGKK